MNAEGEELGSVLYAAYVDEAEQYATALRLAGEVSAACRGGEVWEDRLNQFLALLAAITNRDALLAPTKQRWDQAGRPSDDALRDVMNRIAMLIRQIQSELQSIQQAVQERCDQLADELDVCNRRCRMQRAYQGET